MDDLFGDLCLASPGGGGGGGEGLDEGEEPGRGRVRDPSGTLPLGDWLDDDDDDDSFWSSSPSDGSSAAASAAASAGEGFGGPAAVAQTWRDTSLGVLGEEVARVEAGRASSAVERTGRGAASKPSLRPSLQAGRKSASEMERLTEAAHERKAAAKSRAAEAAAKKAEAEAKAAEAVEAKRRELHGQREQAAEAAASGARAAQARPETGRRTRPQHAHDTHATRPRGASDRRDSTRTARRGWQARRWRRTRLGGCAEAAQRRGGRPHTDSVAP